MDTLGRWAVRFGTAAHSALTWLIYCVVIAAVGGTVVYVLVTAWFGLPTAQLLSEAPVSVSPEAAGVVLLVGMLVVATDTDETGLVRNELAERTVLTSSGATGTVSDDDGPQDVETAGPASGGTHESVDDERAGDDESDETDIDDENGGNDRNDADDTDESVDDESVADDESDGDESVADDESDGDESDADEESVADDTDADDERAGEETDAVGSVETGSDREETPDCGIEGSATTTDSGQQTAAVTADPRDGQGPSATTEATTSLSGTHDAASRTPRRDSRPDEASTTREDRVLSQRGWTLLVVLLTGTLALVVVYWHRQMRDGGR